MAVTRLLKVLAALICVCGLMVLVGIGLTPSSDGTRFLPGARPRAVHVQGVLSQAKRAVAGMRLSFYPKASRPVEAVTTDTGEFEVNLEQAGNYEIVIKPFRHLSSTSRFGTFVEGDNEISIDLPPTSAALSVSPVTGPALSGAIEVLVHGPSSPTLFDRAGVVFQEELDSASLIGLGFGDYTVVATTASGLTSLRPARFTLSSTAPSVKLQLELGRRPLLLRVQDESGSGLELATVRAYGRKVAGKAGVFDLEHVAAGEELQIAAPGYVPSCRLAGYTSSSATIATLQLAGAESALITLMPAVKAPIGVIDGVPGSECPVALGSFATTILPSAGDKESSFRVRGLSDGDYSYRASLSAPTMSFHAPGTGIRYQVPERCRICG